MINPVKSAKLYVVVIMLSFISLTCVHTSENLSDDLDFQALIQPINVSKTGPGPNSGIVSDQVLDAKDYYTWGGSVITGDDGKYHMLYSRWPHDHTGRENTKLDSIFDGMKGWLKYSEIAYAISDHPSGPFKYVKPILQGTGDSTKWNQFTAHNPHIKRFRNNYYLYFVSTNVNESFHLENSDDPLQNHWYRYATGQRIGYLKANSLDDLINGKGEVCSVPIMSPDQKNTYHVATNPSVTECPDGSYIMMFKSWNIKHSHMTHWIATSEQPEGPFKLYGPAFKDADFSAEDPFLWYDTIRKRYYAIIKDFSGSGKLSPQFGALALVTSENGLDDWKPAAYPLVSLRSLDIWNQPKIDLAHLERPQLLLDDSGQPQVLYAAASIKSPFAINDPVKQEKPEHNTFNLHLITADGDFVRDPQIQVKYDELNRPASVSISCPTKSAQIYYTTDRSEPTEKSDLYNGPVIIAESGQIRVKAFAAGKKASRIIVKDISLIKKNYDILLLSEPAKQYSGQGTMTLVDGKMDGNNFNDGSWLGFEGQDFEILFDFKKDTTLQDIRISFLRDFKSWIFPPVKIDYYCSKDSTHFEHLASQKIRIEKSDPSPETINLAQKFNNVNLRFFKVVAKNTGVCPEWHPGAGGKAWLFTDEIIVE